MLQEALILMMDGNFVEGCPGLRASRPVAAESGTLIVRANFHERVGELAGASIPSRY